jgi:biopolymer transport protein TolR
MPKVAPIETGNGSIRSRSRRIASSLSEINVVPLVDVMLVLLIIFMVTAPMLQRGLDVNLPVARRAQELTEERLIVSVPLSFRKDNMVFLGKERVSINVLQERMRQALQGGSGRPIFLQVDAGLTVQDEITVMDLLKSAGVEKLGLLTKLPEER